MPGFISKGKVAPSQPTPPTFSITAACFPSSDSSIDPFGRPCCRSSTTPVAMLGCLRSANRADALVYAFKLSTSLAALHESESGTLLSCRLLRLKCRLTRQQEIED